MCPSPQLPPCSPCRGGDPNRVPTVGRRVCPCGPGAPHTLWQFPTRDHRSHSPARLEEASWRAPSWWVVGRSARAALAALWRPLLALESNRRGCLSLVKCSRRRSFNYHPENLKESSLVAASHLLHLQRDLSVSLFNPPSKVLRVVQLIPLHKRGS